MTEPIWLTRPDEVDEDLREALTVCWRDVTNAGGAVGFAQQLPVDDGVVRPEVDAFVESLGRTRLLVARQDDKVAGWLLLTTNEAPVFAHWGLVTRVQTAPFARSSGLGRTLLTEVARCARDDLKLSALHLDVRGGAGLEPFYERLGWQVTGRYPEAVDLGHGDRRDMVLMYLPLH